ncbi:hypothetical protein SmJEL517_g04123 [Synchytrium microbalum]|uniref:Mannosylglycerate hydrolase MGH1-like glycoside hydrolase domain-containing protein n=1 Tax=Synchytrium microbalum TaxID=1806994 RepID=A0A507BVC2_9FUNG|nr:uncharacterized protein SmJEL517_g04123 [Synchytrium microbalum]TPX32847.1 hypothetical protein SmJEL517_g04123 [Synchytrium microbalum]
MERTGEERRLDASEKRQEHWRRFGPYLSERQWATVREDYSYNGDVWRSFPFEISHLRAYRWGEDGIAGISDNHQRICMSLALWNGKDSILKERLFGLTGPQGNHGEDVKESYFYVDNTPTHSYQKYLYKYPQKRFPYEQLVSENAKRSRNEREYELHHTGVFDAGDYFDAFVEYAKASTDDILMKITIHNRGDEDADIHVLPHVWYRNVWSWKDPSMKDFIRPRMEERPAVNGNKSVHLQYPHFDQHVHFAPLDNGVQPELLFCENETNYEKLYGGNNQSPYCKDAINERVVHDNGNAVNPNKFGTKCAAWYKATVPKGQAITIRVLLTPSRDDAGMLRPKAFEDMFTKRIKEADEFYERIAPQHLSNEMRSVQRQAFAGLLWSKQFYHYNVEEWLNGDPGQPMPPKERKYGRNKDWRHVVIDDILLMPDKWEYPFFANWDSGFHAVIMAMVDPWFAKKQLELMTREWYLHPNGQMPAYEWNFNDLNPPVYGWAAFRVFKIERKMYGKEDRVFLERVFHKLLLNFTYWINKKDPAGLNVFEGGFLGLDNIAVFNRSEALPVNASLRQSDGTSWMAMYCLNMLEISLKLAEENPVYEDMASKFFEHFLYISKAMNFETFPDSDNPESNSLWDEEDGFYYDALVSTDQKITPLKVRSLVGLIPLYPCLVLEPEVLTRFTGFSTRMKWFLEHWDFSKRNVVITTENGQANRVLLALVDREKLVRICNKMFDEQEFLSKHGIRSLSLYHDKNPYTFWVDSTPHTVKYVPGESDSALFGGNSNWRGPLWLPTTFLLIESLQRFHHFYGESVQVEVPSGSGFKFDLWQASQDIQHRIIRLFLHNKEGRRPVNADCDVMNFDPHFSEYVQFWEYFHGETGEGLGASHQTGWSSLVAKCIQQVGITCDTTGYCMPEQSPHWDEYIKKKREAAIALHEKEHLQYTK